MTRTYSGLKYTLLLLSIFITCSLNAQKIPANPNQTDKNGKRQNKWTILFDQDWNIVQEKSKASFYRLITYKDDKPVGKVYDMYLNGKVQTEMTLVTDRPAEVMDGPTTFYRDDGTKERLQIFEAGVMTDEFVYDPDGNLIIENSKMLDSLGLIYEQQRNWSKAYEVWNRAKLKALKEFGYKHVNYANAVARFATVLMAVGNFEQAEVLQLEALEIYKETTGKGVDYARTLLNMSIAANMANNFQKSESLALEARSIFKEVKDFTRYRIATLRLGELYIKFKEFTKGIQNYVDALNTLEQAIGKENPNYAGVLTGLGLLHRRMGNYDKGELYLQEALTIYQKINDPFQGSAMLNLAFVYTKQRKWEQAEILLRDAMRIAKEKYGVHHPNYSDVLKTFGDMYAASPTPDKAESYYLEALQIQKETLGESHQSYFNTLTALTELYETTGDYVKAEALYLKAVEIAKENVGAQHVDYALRLNNLSIFYQYRDDYAKAEASILEAIQVIEITLGKGNVNYGQYLSNLGRIYQEAGNLQKAEKIYQQALGILEQALGPDHPDCALTMNNLGNVYQSLEDPRAEIILQRAVEINKKVLGENTEQYAYSIGNLGVYYFGIKEYAKAEPLYNEALKIQKEVLGDHSYSYLVTLFDLASLHQELKNFEKAESLYLEDSRLWKEAFGSSMPEYERSVRHLGLLYFFKGEYSKGEPYLKESSDQLLRQVERKFPHMSQKEKSLFLENLDNAFGAFASFTVSALSKNINDVGWLYNNTLATKGLLFNAQNKMRDRILTSNDTLLIARYQDWQRSLNTLAQTYQMSTEEKKSQGIDEAMLEERANQMEIELSKSSEFFARTNDKKRYTWLDVQKKLKKGEVAIEIVRFNYYDKNYQEDDSVYYAALIVTPKTKGNPEMLVLENGNDLEGRWVQNYKNNILFKTPDKISYNQFWKKIDDKIKGAKKVYFSADGVYNQISLNTLQNPQTEKYLIDEIEIHLLSNTKDLILRGPQMKTEIKKGIFVGYPDYNRKQQKDTTRNKGQNRNFAIADLLELDSAQRFFNGGNITELPGTKEELSNIQSILNKNQIKSDAYLRQDATEELIKGFRNPQILHIATHGFFLQDAGGKNAIGFMGIESHVLEENPLLRSGLLFAGAKHALKGEAEDGVLTSFESMSLDLDNTELVVLSACETGLGQVVNGEGVYGLQRAFQVAGARTILMSLWTVSDEATKDLMTQFYENWAGKKQTKREAFNNAQKTLMEKYPSPYYWGAFVMVGE